MTMHPDDFENAYRRCETLTAELVKAFAAIRLDAPTIDETAGYADEIAHNLAFMRPQIDEMLRRREEEDTYRKAVAARMREDQAVEDWRAWQAGRAAGSLDGDYSQAPAPASKHDKAEEEQS